MAMAAFLLLGSALLSSSFLQPVEAYLVRFNVIGCTGLPDVDGGFPDTESDPFVVVCFPVGSSPGCQTSGRRDDDLNPTWNFQNDFTVSALAGTVTLNVVDYDSLNADDDLGTISWSYNLAGLNLFQTYTYSSSLPTGTCSFSFQPRDFGIACTVAADCSGHAGSVSGMDTTGCTCSCNSNFQGSSCSSCATGYDTYPSCYRTCTSGLDCNGHASSTTGNLNTGCSCTCASNYQGSVCDACAAGYEDYPNCYRTCTDSLDCSSHSMTVSGNLNTGCTCGCASNYQGSSCESCAPGYDTYPSCFRTCTNTLDCNSHSTSVSGNINSGCSCTCSSNFQGSACDACAAGYEDYPNCYRTCTNALDCNSHASSVSGNLNTGCSCTCDQNSFQSWTGTTCNSCSAGYESYPSCWRTCTVSLDCNNHAASVLDHLGNGCQCTCEYNYAGTSCGQCAKGFSRYHSGNCQSNTATMTEMEDSQTVLPTQTKSASISPAPTSTVEKTATVTKHATITSSPTVTNEITSSAVYSPTLVHILSSTLQRKEESAQSSEGTTSSTTRGSSSQIADDHDTTAEVNNYSSITRDDLLSSSSSSTSPQSTLIHSTEPNVGVQGAGGDGGEQQRRTSPIFGFQSSTSMCIDSFLLTFIVMICILGVLALVGVFLKRREQKISSGEIITSPSPHQVEDSSNPETGPEKNLAAGSSAPSTSSSPFWMRAPLWRSLALHHRWVSLFLICHADCAVAHGLLATSHVLTLLWVCASLMVAASSNDVDGSRFVSETAALGVIILTLLISQGARPLMDFFYYLYRELDDTEEEKNKQSNTSNNRRLDHDSLKETTSSSATKRGGEAAEEAQYSDRWDLGGSTADGTKRPHDSPASPFGKGLRAANMQKSLVYLDQIDLQEDDVIPETFEEMKEMISCDTTTSIKDHKYDHEQQDPFQNNETGTNKPSSEGERTGGRGDEESSSNNIKTQMTLVGLRFVGDEVFEQKEVHLRPESLKSSEVEGRTHQDHDDSFFSNDTSGGAVMEGSAHHPTSSTVVHYSATPQRRTGYAVNVAYIITSSILCILLGSRLSNPSSSTTSKLCVQFENTLLPLVLIVDALILQPFVVLIIFLYRRFLADDEQEELDDGTPSSSSSMFSGLHPQDTICVCIRGP